MSLPGTFERRSGHVPTALARIQAWRRHRRIRALEGLLVLAATSGVSWYVTAGGPVAAFRSSIASVHVVASSVVVVEVETKNLGDHAAAPVCRVELGSPGHPAEASTAFSATTPVPPGQWATYWPAAVVRGDPDAVTPGASRATCR